MSVLADIWREAMSYEPDIAQKLIEGYERHLHRSPVQAEKELAVCERQMAIEARRDAARREQLKQRIERGLAVSWEYREFLSYIDIAWKEEVRWELTCWWKRSSHA